MDEQKQPTPPKPAHQPGTSKGEEKTQEEGKQPGRHDTESTGGADRPSGTWTAKDSTGVNPKDPVDPESPHMPAP